MPLWANPPMAVDLYSPTSTRDGGGGVAVAYTLAQSACPCSIATNSASERDQQGTTDVAVSVRIAVLKAALTTVPGRGWKAVETGSGRQHHVTGVSEGRAYGSVPELVYLEATEQLP